MAVSSSIQWTDATWNIAVGCRKVDSDCKYCYMYRDSFNGKRYDPKAIRKTTSVFNLPLKIKKPSKIFTCSLTDFFLPEIDDFREEAWAIMRACPEHTFQILTKRPDRIEECLPSDWGSGYENVWLGTSVGSNGGLHRIGSLAWISAAVKFISFEPLHENLNLQNQPMGCFDWAIIGGESGHETGKYRYRECKLDWIRGIKNTCEMSGVSVFVKQMGTFLAKEMNMSDKHGGNIDEFPIDLQVRNFPNGK